MFYTVCYLYVHIWLMWYFIYYFNCSIACMKLEELHWHQKTWDLLIWSKNAIIALQVYTWSAASSVESRRADWSRNGANWQRWRWGSGLGFFFAIPRYQSSRSKEDEAGYGKKAKAILKMEKEIFLILKNGLGFSVVLYTNPQNKGLQLELLQD